MPLAHTPIFLSFSPASFSSILSFPIVSLRSGRESSLALFLYSIRASEADPVLLSGFKKENFSSLCLSISSPRAWQQ